MYIDLQRVSPALLRFYSASDFFTATKNRHKIMEQVFTKSKFKIATRQYKDFLYPYFEVWHYGKRTRIQLHCKVKSGQWCKSKQRAYISPLLNDVDNYNNEIANREIETSIIRYNEFICYFCNNPISRDEISNTIKSFMGRPLKQSKQAEKLDIMKIIENAIINNNQIAKGSQENYLKGLRAFKAFSDFREKPIDSFEMIDGDLIEAFKEFLCNGHYTNKGKPYAMASLNSLIRYAVSAIKCVPTHYLSKSQARHIPQPQLGNKTAKTNEIGLRDGEIIKLWKYKPKTRLDEEIRDMFLLLCLTGQRVNEFERNNIEGGICKIEGIPCLRMVQEKRSHKLDVDIIFPLAEEILNKYDKLPTINLKKRINKNMPRIAKEAGITGVEKVSIHYQGNDKTTEKLVPRVELIHSHTGRRTFVSILSIHGWSYERIKKYTGQSLAIVEHYDKSTNIDKRIYKKSQPNERLEIIGEEITQSQPQQPSNNGNAQLGTLPNSIDEALDVLTFLEVPSYEWIESRTDIGFLIRLISDNEQKVINRLVTQDGFKERLDKIKELFNTEAKMKERIKCLHELDMMWRKEDEKTDRSKESLNAEAKMKERIKCLRELDMLCGEEDEKTDSI